MLKNELDIHVDDEIFWTDSKVVLGYINSDARRFKVFVANRVQQIRDHTSPKQWHYVESSSNPVDDASQGLESKKKDQIRRWFDGPSFPWNKKQCWLEKVSWKRYQMKIQKSGKWSRLMLPTFKIALYYQGYKR